MFASLESFSVFFFVCLGLIILAMVFEDKLIEFEERRMKRGKNKQKTKSYGTSCK